MCVCVCVCVSGDMGEGGRGCHKIMDEHDPERRGERERERERAGQQGRRSAMLVKLSHTTSDEIVRPCRSLMNVQGKREGGRGVGQPSPSLVIKGKKEREREKKN